ncbi:MAG: ACP S-malonyltransferase [Desulfatitalea sp.]|nr:ACP S-malonyltransferase [Desulfatitalea sp.]
MKKIAFLFPGQGSQKVGMGQDLCEAHNEVKAVFAAADEVTGLPISRLCFEGPIETLTQTINLQPAITAVNLACLAVLEKAAVAPYLCAGHSLGEYSALCAAGVVSAGDCLKLVFKRGELMHREATRNQGAMSAIVGLTIDQVEAIVARAASKGVVAVANHNSAEQIVITGAPEAVQAAGAAAAEQGARAIPLAVSGAWHSPLIQGAEAAFEAFLKGIAFNAPKCPVIHNVTADTAPDPQQIRTLMARQLCSPVRWYDTMGKMAEAGTEVFVEIGPGRVLTGLLKKILPAGHGARTYNVYDLKTAEKFLQAEG